MKRRSTGVLVLCLRVIDCDVIDWIDLPELESIQFGYHSFAFKQNVVSSSLIMRSVS